MALGKVKKVGTQISGGSTNLGRLGQKGNTGAARSPGNIGRLGVSSMTNRNVAKLSSQMSSNLGKGAHA